MKDKTKFQLECEARFWKAILREPHGIEAWNNHKQRYMTRGEFIEFEFLINEMRKW